MLRKICLKKKSQNIANDRVVFTGVWQKVTKHTIPISVCENTRAMENLEEKICAFLKGKGAGAPLKALEIAKGVGLGTTKDVNRALYSLQRKGRLQKVGDTPPLWSLAGSSRSAAMNDTPNPTGTPSKHKIKTILKSHTGREGATPKEPARDLNQPSRAVNAQLHDMLSREEVEKDGSFSWKCTDEDGSNNNSKLWRSDSITSTVDESSDSDTSVSTFSCESEVKSEMNNQDESSSGGIVFQSSSTANRPNMACSSADVRPKRKLAPSFSNALSKESGVKNNNLKKVPEKTTPDSCFLRDYDQIMSIGKGGFGRVFKARKIIEDKNVAVKIVKSTKKALREVNALSHLQHRNIVRYYHAWIEDTPYQQDPSDCSSSTSDSGSTAKYVYIQMELCEGGTLRAWIKERNGNSGQEMRDEKALHILQQVVDGVQYIHSKKLIHRDLKPLNILFASDKTVKIGDFGLVTSAEGDSDEAMLERTKGKGTRSYMSPEQMNQHKYDKEVDIFALGLIYFELLWRMTTYNERSKIWEDVRRRKFPTQFCMKHNTAYKLIERMLSERPEDRPDAREIASELAKYCTSIKEDQNALQELKTV